MNKKKVIITIIAIPLVLIVLGVVAVYAFVLPASPESVCTKLIDLGRSDVEKAFGKDSASKYTDEDLIGRTKADCIKLESNRTKGLLNLKKERECILNSKTQKEASKC